MRPRFKYALPVFAGFLVGASRDTTHQQGCGRRCARRWVPCRTLDPSHRSDTTETAIKMRNSWCPWLMSSSGKYWHPIYSRFCCDPMLLSRHPIITGGDSCGWLAGYTAYLGLQSHPTDHRMPCWLPGSGEWPVALAFYASGPSMLAKCPSLRRDVYGTPNCVLACRTI
ncbi:hypothetical protein BKA58DRAFT_380321 [Alternaria rosae]|uniref:uncharacterized protein n=1 Tax=Alternaria rosae TaxID=1187941 RepID=UPI001E8CC87B|nr:uncharacterized protein BKA58DRAFT_380321 [Alternaria rosae]KAH6875713.1 hypothetical protein BKA58DRAFT_380321 [Alternaria rosae]